MEFRENWTERDELLDHFQHFRVIFGGNQLETWWLALPRSRDGQITENRFETGRFFAHKTTRKVLAEVRAKMATL